MPTQTLKKNTGAKPAPKSSPKSAQPLPSKSAQKPAQKPLSALQLAEEPSGTKLGFAAIRSLWHSIP